MDKTRYNELRKNGESMTRIETRELDSVRNAIVFLALVILELVNKGGKNE